jgi:hypothetical protein
LNAEFVRRLGGIAIIVGISRRPHGMILEEKERGIESCDDLRGMDREVGLGAWRNGGSDVGTQLDRPGMPDNVRSLQTTAMSRSHAQTFDH